MDIQSRYVYSLVRCVPDPRTGEFVNVAAIAGDPESDDWALRQVSSESRVRKLANIAALGAVHTFLARIGTAIDDFQTTLPLNPTDDLPGEGWLNRLYWDHRNVVQLSQPAPILAASAEEALDVLFARQIIDPVTDPRVKVVTKHGVLRALRGSYSRAGVQARPRVELFVGDRVHTLVDFAVASDDYAVQLSQAWSFQGKEVVSEQVKAWGYAIGRLREGEQAHVQDVASVQDWGRAVDPKVDVQVVVTDPTTQEQEDAFGEALQVFKQLEASILSIGQVDSVGQHASELLGTK
jgi:Protein of unknown function (DUF3037)